MGRRGGKHVENIYRDIRKTDPEDRNVWTDRYKGMWLSAAEVMRTKTFEFDSVHPGGSDLSLSPASLGAPL